MLWIAVGVAAMLAMSGTAFAAAPIYDPVMLNIGVNCQWQKHCISKQRRAMESARKYIEKRNPPLWRIHVCNRNAARSPERVDWIGFNNCIRNRALQPPSARAQPIRRR